MCMRASGASELRKFWHFYILKLLFLSIFCRYIENKPWLNFIWGGGQAPPKPPTSTPVGLIIISHLLLYYISTFNEISVFVKHNNGAVNDKTVDTNVEKIYERERSKPKAG